MNNLVKFKSTFTPPIFYGWWLVVATLFLNSATGTPAFGAVGLWVDSLEREFHWSRTQLSWAFSLGQLEGSIAGPIIGILVAKYGARNVVLIGISTCGLGFALLSQTQSLVIFYVSYAILMIGAGAGGWLPMMTVINDWFDKKRGIAMGLGGMGFSIGGFFLIPFLAFLMLHPNIGWRITALGLSVFYIIIMYPLFRIIRNTPEEYDEIPDGIRNLNFRQSDQNIPSTVDEPESIDLSVYQIVKIPVFWIISISHAASTMLIGTMTVHLILSLIDQGMSTQVASTIWGTTLLVSGAGQILGGYMSDKVTIKYALCIFGCMQAVGVVIATFVTSVYSAPLFVIVFGLSFGARVPLGTAIRSQYFGRKSFGKVLGISMMPMSILMMVGPLVAGRMYDSLGDYKLAFYLIAAVSVLGSLGFLFAKKPTLN
jgi:MFS family permease